MTVLTPPGYLQGGTYTALLDRIYAGTVKTVRDFAHTHRAREGFLPSRMPVYTNPAGLQIAVSACAGIIANDFAADAGEYLFSQPSSTTVTLSAASPTLNRIDIVGFQVKDHFYDASGLNQITVAVLQGSGSAGAPSAPAIPAGFLPVVQVLVNALATTPTSMTSLIARTTLEGAPLPVANATERGTLGTPHQGFMIYRLDRNWMEKWDGAAWRLQGVAITTSTSDRDSAITNPQNGDLAVSTDTGTVWLRHSSAWVAQASVGVWTPRAAAKTADESVTSSTTLQDDNHLTVALEANATYLFTWHFVYNAPVAAGGFKQNFTVPSGCTGVIAGFEQASGSGFSGSFPSLFNWAPAAGDRSGLMFGRITTTNAGTLTLQWAQNASSGSAVILRQGSMFRFDRIA